ncbi:hypothetical protein BT96DRAFT_1007509 [Gymnopus androsaceus JB14]|uniref:Uncharacterized protein n=1 Tax=Gymnopus androsaceus JB14 TaxID=1447944 RepID=A0A6A4GI01_9AGAR|nr:hypothetical protein BT96DRAFT_1007509 [Gymnopus androsaceus JB14]
MAPSVLTWAEPVVTEPVDVSQLAGTGALVQVSKSTQDVIDKSSQQLHVISVQRPLSSQVIRYLDALDAGFDVSTRDSAPIVTAADILHRVAYDKLTSSLNKIGHASEPVSQSSEHSVEHGTSKASPSPLSLQPASQRSEGLSAPCNSRASAPPAQSPATADASATFSSTSAAVPALPLDPPAASAFGPSPNSPTQGPAPSELGDASCASHSQAQSQPGFSQSMVAVNSVAPEKPSSAIVTATREVAAEPGPSLKKRSAMGTEERALMKQSG